MVWKHTPVVNPRTVSVPQIPVLVCRSCFCSLIVPFLPVFYPASYLALETHAYLSAVLPVDLLRPYGSVFPFALAERSWVWILLELSPHVGGAKKKSIPPSTYLIYDIGVHMLMNWKVVRWWWKWSWCDVDGNEVDVMLMEMKLMWCWCYDVGWASIWCGWCDGQYMPLEKLKRNKNHIIIQICLFIL